ncbi:MAG: hypothetical protein IT449_14085 [Phycisphaerales bacterium]|nr:hypothetical protein [Phycisphaerales bacterium]
MLNLQRALAIAPPTRFFAAAAAILLVWEVSARSARAQATERTAQPAHAEVAAWIEKLAAPKYQDRIEATRRLCQMGPVAREALRAACKSESFELSTRAQQLVAVLDRQFFAGVRVTLTASKPSVAWDEPLSVVIELENTSAYEARVPLELGAAPAADSTTVTDLQQATAMVDAGDFLEVADGAGQPVALRLDDINEEPAINAMISARASAGPVQLLKPGEKASFVLAQFNRGWARFPLLTAGEATIRFSYVPEWPEDETFGEFNRQRIGEVSSAPIRVRVTRGAPETLSRSGRMAEIKVEASGDEYIAKILCLYDKPIQLNVQYGATLPFAQFHWMLSAGEEDRTIPGAEQSRSRLTDFAASGFSLLQPGESLELGRVKAARVREVCAAPPNPSTQPWRLTASYINLCSRAWQLDQQRRSAEEWKTMPPQLQSPLPSRIFAGQLRTEAITLEPKP